VDSQWLHHIAGMHRCTDVLPVIFLDACSFKQKLLSLRAKKALQMLPADEAHCRSPSAAMPYVLPVIFFAACRFKHKLLSLHAKKDLQMLPVDEAHCISSWGHNVPAHHWHGCTLMMCSHCCCAQSVAAPRVLLH
jgi:hypothetical protein